MEAWEKVFIDLGNKETPAALDSHLERTTCEGCHRGDPAEHADVDAAHEGLVADPSRPETGACNTCHFQISKNYFQSMHFTLQGEKRVLARRAGADSFESCPQSLRDGFGGECASCHATCGDCHISRPDANGKGFIKNHRFQKKPHQLYQCMGCHGARIGYDYMGDDEAGRKPDVHFTKGMGCGSCHSGKEMHAAAGDADDRYHVDAAPRCEDCHDVADSNAYHAQHWDDLTCHVCHAQGAYVNCAGCHAGNAWKEDAAYTENNPFEAFRIGLNPFADRPHKFATLRHAPVVPDTFAPWGYEGDLPGFAALPTWKFTTPHAIRRWTNRTEVETGAGCGSNCHLGAPDGSPANAGLFLWQQEIEAKWPAEAGANEHVVVDDNLPAGWQAP